MPHSNASLAIELSARVGEVAVGVDGKLIGIEGVRKHGRHDDDLMAAVDRLFRRAGLGPGNLRQVYVSIGPGGFTGLRIAVATAKMLALACAADLVAVPTASVIAHRIKRLEGRLAVCLAGKHDRTWRTLFEFRDAGWSPVDEGALVSFEEALNVEGLQGLAGDFLPEALLQVAQKLGCPVFQVAPTAQACWEVGQQFANLKRFEAAAELTPLYAREPEAVRLWAMHRR